MFREQKHLNMKEARRVSVKTDNGIIARWNQLPTEVKDANPLNKFTF